MKKDNVATEGQNLDAVAAEKATKLETGELLTGEPNEKLLIIRHDDAQIVYERKHVAIAGILNTPFMYLDKRVGLDSVVELASHLIVNRQKMSLELTVNEEDHFLHEIDGKLEFHPDFIAFGINSGQSWEAFKLADFVRMNRTFFESIDFANKLVTSLKTFKAKIETEKEKIQKQNGDFRTVFGQVVSHNLPEQFQLTVPIFKGYPKETFAVEVHVNPSDLSMMLISPDAKDKQQELIDTAIDEQLILIKAKAPDLLITEK